MTGVAKDESVTLNFKKRLNEGSALLTLIVYLLIFSVVFDLLNDKFPKPV